MSSTAMEHERPWWQTTVVYQVYPRSFQDSNGDGIGDLPGITQRLEYLAETLGVGAIWISPFYPSPMADFGYDVSDYCDVDPMFGTLADFDELVAAAHRRGLAIIADWVPNHTSDEHPWFQASRSSRNDPKRDWYVWRDATDDGSPPNNWQSVFGGSAWEWDAATSQYYLHSFLKEQPDLNWRNPDVEAAMLDTLRFWLDRGVDGFRIDVAHYVMKDPDLTDNPEAPRRDTTGFKPMGAYDRWLHINSKGHDDAHRIYRKVRSLLDSYPGDRFAVGEIHEFDWDVWARYYGENLDELHMPFNFSMLFAPWSAAEWRTRIAAMDDAMPAGAWPNHVLGNHDETRLADRLGPDHMRAAAVLLLTLRGTPTMYYGDEIGMRQARIPDDLQQDPWGLRVPGQGRDGCRTPMRWEPGPGAGFTAPRVEPWLPIGPDGDHVNVATQLEDAGSLLSLYRRLLTLRRSSQALTVGDQRLLDAGEAVLAYTRTSGDDEMMIAVNFSDQPATVEVPAAAGLVLSTASGPEGPAGAEPYRLAAHEAAVFVVRRGSATDREA